MQPHWRDEFVLDSAERGLGARGELRRKIRSGELSRVARGVYRAPVPRSLQPARAGDLEYLHRVQAAQLTTRESLLFSRHSAAVLWQLPAVEPWPGEVHVLSGPATGGRSTAALARHTVGHAESRELYGLRVTTLARTVVDIARSSSLRQAVTMADAALHGLRGRDGRIIRAPIRKEELLAELAAAGSGRGVVQARVAIEIADGAAESPGESCSRVGFHLLGLPKPQLQVTFHDRFGRIGTVDFWWPEFNLIGEFDGHVKYEDPLFLNGRTPRAALLDEKRREDRLRAGGRGLTRWEWDTALSLPRLRAHMTAAGLC